jgi:hypothetical protein
MTILMIKNVITSQTIQYNRSCFKKTQQKNLKEMENYTLQKRTWCNEYNINRIST